MILVATETCTPFISGKWIWEIPLHGTSPPSVRHHLYEQDHLVAPFDQTYIDISILV